MSKEIILNWIEYNEKWDALYTSATGITSDIGALPETSSSIQTLQKYQEALSAIGDLIALYKELLQKDIGSISQVSQDMTATDIAMSNIINACS